MKISQFTLPVLVAGALFAPVVSTSAQGPAGQGGGMPQMSPAAMAKMQAYRKFGESHRNYRALQRTLTTVMELDKDPKTKLTKDQAKKMLAVMKPWQTKPTLTDSQALAVNKQLSAVLNLTQIKKMATMAADRGGRGGGGRPGGGPGGGGPGGGGGGGRGFDMSKMPAPKEYNPLNPATYPASPYTQRSKTRLTTVMTLLKQRAA